VITQRKRLSDIVQGADRDKLASAWANTEAAEEFAPLPAGQYLCRTVCGEAHTAKSGTPGYKLTLEVAEGDHEGRKLFLDFWLTSAALPMSKREFAKLGINSLEQLDRPLPAVLDIRATVKRQRDDAGTEFNKVTRFEVIGIAKGDAFEPDTTGASENQADPFPSVRNGETAGTGSYGVGGEQR